MFHQGGLFQLMACVLIVSIAWVWLSERYGNWGRTADFVIGIFLIVVMIQYSRKSDAEVLASVSAGPPEWIDLADDGVTIRAKDGRSIATPWTLAHQWGFTRHVIVIQFLKDEPCVLPLTSLSGDEKSAVIEFVRQKLGSASFEA